MDKRCYCFALRNADSKNTFIDFTTLLLYNQNETSKYIEFFGGMCMKKKSGFITSMVIIVAVCIMLLPCVQGFGEQFIDNGFKLHPIIFFKGMGYCNDLTGDVMVTAVMVDDPYSSWTETDIEAEKTEFINTANDLMNDAASHGVQLNITFNFIHCSVDRIVDSANVGKNISELLAAAGLSTTNSVHPKLEKQYSVKEAPIVFSFNREGRAFAIRRVLKDDAEYAVVYNNQNTFKHELLHLFDAYDFYLPIEVEAAAEKYFPESVMLIGDPQGKVDSLTAYLIGWEEEIPDDARLFLDETASVSVIKILRSVKDSRENNFDSINYDEGVYSGYLSDGKPHGEGTIKWSDGSMYRGEWQDGKKHGQGVYTFSDGTQQSGRWENDQFVG